MVFTSKTLILLGLSLFAIALQGCGPRLSSEAQEFLSQSEDIPVCDTDFTYTDFINLNAQAKFFKRHTDPVIVDNKIKNMILSDPITEALPIPYAEVAIYTADKELIQCGVTDFNGNLTAVSGGALTIPDTPQSYIIRVYARTNKVMPVKGFSANAAVKEDPYTNKVYYLETTFSSDGVNTTPIELIAYARQTDDLNIKGAAFNIYNNFIQAYTYLDDNLTVPDAELTCLSNQLSIYWKPGFNPVQYTEPTADPNTLSNTSFHNSTGLFISGGQVGDISLMNTDHFDDFVVIHEMGHFIDEQCGRLDSPGGNHFIAFRIDGRLAWHEAWASFFASAVTNSRLSFLNPELATRIASGTTGDLSWSFLNNTAGFSDSVQNVGNGTGFMMDLKKAGTSPGEIQAGSFSGVQFDPINSTLYPGEGHFREGAITRSLFKMSVTSATVCSTCGTASFASAPVSFTIFWQAFDAQGGMGTSTNHFSNSNFFLENIKTLVTAPTWAANLQAVADAEALQLFSDHGLSSAGLKYVTNISGTDHLTWVPYGHNLVQSVCVKPTVLQARSDDPSLTGSSSDQRFSNHFYTLDPLTLFGLDTLSVTFTRVSGTNTDHDLLIFEEDYEFNDDYGCAVAEVNGSCPNNNFTPVRSTNTAVIASNRAPAATLGTTYTKTISGLLGKLDLTKKYLLNIRAYTAGKSLSSSTMYQYTMTSDLGDLCPE